MLCFFNLKKSLLYSLLFSFLVLSFSLAVNVADTYALDDIVLTSDTLNLCNNQNCYSLGYRYLYYTFQSLSSYSYARGFRIQQINSSNSIVSYYVPPIAYFGLIELTPDFHITNIVGFTDEFSPVVTISDHLPSSFLPPAPSGNIDITENGTYDVTNYATATVNIENEIIYGDYHNDLININNSILICGAICLVLYFFYSIYRMIIKSTGGS